MMQITSVSTAKPVSTGLDFLAGASGEAQDSTGFEDALSSQMASDATSGADFGQAPKQVNGKSGKATGKSGKASGKILPEGQELPVQEGKAAANLPVKPEMGGEPKEETAEGASQQPALERIPLVMVPLLATTVQQASEAPGLSDGGAPQARSQGLLPQAATMAKLAVELPIAVDRSATMPKLAVELPVAADRPATLAKLAVELPVAADRPTRMSKLGVELPVAADRPATLAKLAVELPVAADRPTRMSKLAVELPVAADRPTRMSNLAMELPVAADRSAMMAKLAVELPVAKGQGEKAVQPATDLPISLDQAAGKAGQPLQIARGLLSVQSLPIQAMNGNAIRLRPVLVKGGEAGAESAATPAVDPASLASAPAEDAALLVPTPGEEAVPTSSTPARQMARIAGLSARERPDMPQQLAGAMEAPQDVSGWFGPSANAQSSAAQSGTVLPNGQVAPAHGAERPHDFAALVDQLVAAREFATPTPVHASVNHAEFGQVSLKFEHGDQGLSVAVSSADPDFARAVQAAAPSDKGGSMSDHREGGSTGNSTTFRQDTQAQSFNTGTQPQSRNAGGNDNQAGEVRPLRRENAASSPEEARKPRQDGIFA